MKKIVFTTLLFIASISIYAQKDTVGIYYANGNSLIKIEPIKYSKTKTNTLGSALTMGIANSSVKTIYRGGSSLNKTSKETKFYFYFASNKIINASEMMQNWMFINSYSPKDFIIAKLNPKGNSRELRVAKINVYAGMEMGVADDALSDITSKQIKNGIYEVTIKNASPGEYCFMYNGANGSGAYLPIFDFSIE